MRKFVAGVSCALLVLVFVKTTQAQTAQGVVTGSVVDSSGAVVLGADLTLTNEGTAVQQKDVTRSDGSYRFGLVPPGTYTLAVKAQGFTERDVRGIIVDASQVVPVNVTLSVATAQAVVEVTEQEPSGVTGSPGGGPSGKLGERHRHRIGQLVRESAQPRAQHDTNGRHKRGAGAHGSLQRRQPDWLLCRGDRTPALARRIGHAGLSIRVQGVDGGEARGLLQLDGSIDTGMPITSRRAAPGAAVKPPRTGIEAPEATGPDWRPLM